MFPISQSQAKQAHVNTENSFQLRHRSYDIEFRKNVYAVKLQNFQYRILTRSLTTNYKCSKWHPEVSPLCTFCNEKVETMVHLLFDCILVRKLWKALERWVKYFMKLEVKFEVELVILNHYKGPQKRLINTFIIVMKQFIYAQKCFGNIPYFKDFVQRIVKWYHVEKQMAIKDNKFKFFAKKWKVYADI